MTQIIVELVKYDTEKTTKRKRANLIVEVKSEASVIEKLEKIHKGDSIKTIHEIVWGEEAVPERQPGKTYTGMVKYFEQVKGFGFIQRDDEKEDIFFHGSALGGEQIYDEDLVEFELGESPKGKVAIHIKLID